MPDARVLYDTDFYGWTREQSALLRAKAELLPNDAVDWAHVAEEIEDMGNEVPHAIESACVRILEHLLKLEWSPADRPRNGWRQSVREHRVLIRRRVVRNPGVAPKLDGLFADAWPDARALAAAALREEDGIDPRTLPADCPYTRTQVEDFDWYPPNRHGLA